jgi:hypothetical protein
MENSQDSVIYLLKSALVYEICMKMNGLRFSPQK